MMVHIRHTAHSQLPEAITRAVIGRPINFQGLGGDDANRQAQGILERAAKRAGFQEVVFQYEPVAAGPTTRLHCGKRSVCWSWILAAAPPTAPCC